MKQIRIVGLPVIVAMILGAGFVAGASASAPEFGRCLKAATKSLSNFDNAKCVKLASEDSGTEAEKLKKGNFFWTNTIVKPKFTTKIKEGTIATLETVGGTKITCLGETSDGEFVNPKEVGWPARQIYRLRNEQTEMRIGRCRSRQHQHSAARRPDRLRNDR